MTKTLFSTLLLGGCLFAAPPCHSQEKIDPQQISVPGLSPADLTIPGLDISPDMVVMLQYYMEKGFPTEEQFKQMELMPQQTKSISKAPKDGCFYEIGSTRNKYMPNGMSESDCIDCENSGGIIKHNQSYVWGLTNDEKNIFWGTNFNYVCTGSIEVALKSVGKLEGFNPFVNECLVCEYDKAAEGYADNMNKDWRPPRIYRYDKATRRTKDITPDTEKDPNINKAFGLRSAGTFENFTVIAGPNSQDHISMYWYDNTTPFESESNGYIGSWTMTHLPGYENKVPFNVRRWIVANDDLYCAVEYVNTEEPSIQRGAILRWKREVPFDYGNDGGDPSAYFEVVGWTVGGAGDLCLMNDRIYVSTMPSMTICQGPKMDGKRLPVVKDENDTPWHPVFSYKDYDPDLVCRNAVAGGALLAFNGKLYFGTMHISMQYALFTPRYYGENAFEDPSAILKTILGAQRASAIFRLSEHEDGTTSTELLYGEEELPAFNFQTKQWEIKPTGMTPLYGKSGFNNTWNYYTWSMNVFNDKLYCGTQDWTNMWVPMLRNAIPLPGQVWDLLSKVLKETNLSGFDVYCFEDHESAAKIVTTNGFHVQSSYGVRNMVNDGDKLYLGSASGHNLAETGGWELLEMTTDLPLLVPDIKWKNKKTYYGENWKEELPSAAAKVALMEVPGTYDYTLNHMKMDEIDYLEPGEYNLRVNFTPKNQGIYKPVSDRLNIHVDKAPLNVVGEQIEINAGDSFDNIYGQEGYTMEGFVYGQSADILEEKPVAKLTTVPDGPGTYEIAIEGGKSGLYDFNYVNGALIIKVPNDMTAESADETQMYPVPFKDRIYLKSQKQIERVEIANLAGAVVFSVEKPEGSMDLSSLNEGIYIITIHTAEGKIVRKVTKE